VANEGRFVAFAASADAGRTLDVLRRYEVTHTARVIGEVRPERIGQVSCRGPLGVARAIDMLSGEQLPRIC
jgi:hydrogenase expression/formation protein HypE